MSTHLTNDSVNTLEPWLMSPRFWSGKKLCEFFAKAHKSIKENPSMKNVMNSINEAAKAPEWNFWNIKQDWKEVLGSEHLRLVKKGSHKPYGTSVMELLRLIRNKYEHYAGYDVDQMKSLGWFLEKKNIMHFDEELFGNYWNSRFPNLGMFLWIQFWQLREGPLKCFYPNSITFTPEMLNPNCIYEEIITGFNVMKNQGYMVSRYVLTNSPETKIELKFISVTEELLRHMLNGNTTMSAILSKNLVHCTWHDKAGTQVTSKYSEGMSISKEVHIIAVTRIADAENVLLKFKLAKLNSEKCIILFNRETETQEIENSSIEKMVNSISKRQDIKVSYHPISWPELKTSTRHKIASSSKVLVQAKTLLISKFFSKLEENLMEDLLSKLTGNVLNQLLRGEIPKILSKLSLAKPPTIYMNRILSKRIIFHWPDLKFDEQSDVFVISGIEKKKVTDLFNCSDNSVKTVHKLDDLTNIDAQFVLHFPEISKQLVCKNVIFLNKSTEKSLHFLHYLQEDKFRWVHTAGRVTSFENSISEFSEYSKDLSETEFMERLVMYRKDEKLIFIADLPGMGKSQILQSMGRMLINERDDTIVVWAEISNFLKHFEENKSDEKDTSEIICTLVSSNNFEKAFIRCLLKSSNKFYKVEVMLDGLDEVPLGQRNQALEIVKTLDASKSFSRIWVTLRNHVFSEVFHEFNSSGYEMLPLSKEEQFQFLIMHWTEYCKNQGQLDFNPESSKLRAFAKACVNIPMSSDETDITGIPLQCKMLAEIYERQVLAGNFEHVPEEKQRLVKIYENLMQRKLDVYSREKHLINIPPEHALTQIIKQNFELLHVYYATKLLFSHKIANQFTTRLLSGFSSLKDIEKLVLEIGIVSNLDPVTFVHRTYAEFVLASFIFKVLSNQFYHLSSTDKLFKVFLWQYILDFQTDKVNIPHFPAYENCQFKHITVCHFLNELLQTEESANLANSQYALLYNKVFDGIVDIFKRNLLYIDDLVQHAPRFAAAACSKLFHVFSIVLQLHRETKGLFVVGLMSQNLEMIEALVELEEELKPVQWYKLKEIGNNRNNVLHYIIYGPFKYRYFVSTKETEPLIRYVVKHDKSVLEDRNASDQTPLLFLTSHQTGSFSPCLKTIMKLLIRLGADVNVRYSNGDTILHMDYSFRSLDEYTKTQVAHQYVDIWRVALRNGCKFINEVDAEGFTPLARAMHITKCYWISPGLLGVLNRKYGADCNVKFPNGKYLLHVAIEDDFSADFCFALVKGGANMFAKNHLGQTAYDLAVLSKRGDFILCKVTDFYNYMKTTACIRHILEGSNILHTILQGVCIEENFIVGVKETPPFTRFDVCGPLIRIKTLIIFLVLQFPMLLEERNEQGQTPLLFLLSIYNDFCFEVFKNTPVYILLDTLVIDLKAELNVVDANKNTILHHVNMWNRYASRYSGHFYYTRFLYHRYLKLFLRMGFDKQLINTKNAAGDTPLHIILSWFSNTDLGLKQTMMVYKNIGADFNIKNANGLTPLMLAITGQYSAEFVRFLCVTCGADPLQTNLEGETALHLAAKLGDLNVAQTIVGMSKMALYAKDKVGKTPLEYCSTWEVYRFLEYALQQTKP